MRELTWRNDVSVEMPASCIACSSKLDLRMKLLFLEIFSFSMSIFTHLTPELSRADRGGREAVLPACRQFSTKPRHGVGLNDLLGGKEAGEAEAAAQLPKGRSPEA